MKAAISLKAVVDEIDGLSEDHVAYLNLQTGELVTLSPEEISAVEEDIAITDLPEWQQALITKARDVLASDDYLQLPTRRDIHECTIMDRFCSGMDRFCSGIVAASQRYSLACMMSRIKV